MFKLFNLFIKINTAAIKIVMSFDKPLLFFIL